MYKIRIYKQKHNFSAAHFITFENDCEALHGHNYYATLEMEGELDENSYLMDFRVVKKRMEAICNSLDHKVLIAMNSKKLKIEKDDNSFEVIYSNKRYLFPEEDVVPLPIDNTTVERLSEYIAEKLVETLKAAGMTKKINFLEIGVEETAGQMASYRMSL